MMSNNKEIIVNIEKQPNTKMEDSVLKYTKSFLKSEKCTLMEICFSCIRNDDNDRVFKETIETIDDLEFDALFPLVSNIILTANKIECDCLNYFFSKQRNSYLKKRKHSISIIPGHNVGAADAYVFKFGAFYLLHINAFDTGSNTPGGSTDIVRFISSHPLLKPNTIISFGVCYGRDPDKQNIGDVIIPQKLYPWSIGQKIVDKTLIIKSDDFNLRLFDAFNDTMLYSTLKNFCNGDDGRNIREFIQLSGANDLQEFKIKTTMGNMSTGEAVVSSSDAKRIIVESTNNDKELGGEMEGYGIAKECVYYANIPCVIIKAICDWGVMKNIEDVLQENGIAYPKRLKDKFQAYAAFCAGIVLFKLFEEEQELFSSHNFMSVIGKTISGKNFLNGYTCVTKRAILKALKSYFGDDTSAKKVFETLVKNSYIKTSLCNQDEFIINF